MRNFSSIVFAAVSTVVLSVGPTLAETTLRLATIAPEATPWGNQLGRFAAAVAEESNGEIKIDVFYSGQLGSEQDTFAQLARGRIDMGFFSNTSVALQVPEAIFASMYLYFDDPDERDCILDSHMVEPIRAAFAPRGAYFLGFAEAGPNNFFGSTGTVLPTELAGKKIGLAISPVASAFWETYGAIPTAISSAEGASAMQTGLVDFGIAPPLLYVAAGYNKLGSVYSYVGVQYNSAMVLLSERTRSQLTEEQFAAIERAWARHPAAQLRDEIAQVDAVMLAKHVESGGTLLEPTPEEKAAWRAPMAEFYAKAVEITGEPGANMFAALEAGRAACKK